MLQSEERGRTEIEEAQFQLDGEQLPDAGALGFPDEGWLDRYLVFLNAHEVCIRDYARRILVAWGLESKRRSDSYRDAIQRRVWQNHPANDLPSEQ